MQRSPRRMPSLAGPLCLALLATLAGSAALAGECSGVETLGTSELAAPGPHPVGRRTFIFVDESRPVAPNGDFAGAPERTLTTEVWYPATAEGRDAEIASSAGPFPVIVHSHGFTSFRTAMSQLTEHLASRGFIVAAADFPLSNIGAPGGPTVADVVNQPEDWSFVLDRVLETFGADADDERIAALGLSLGGLTTLLATFHEDLRDPRIDTALAMAPPACFFTPKFFETTRTPLMILHGDSDQLVPYRSNGRDAFDRARAPKFLARLKNGSHTGFTSFATSFDQGVHFDAIGCAAVEGTIGDETDANPFEALGGREKGISLNPRRCAELCADGVPAEPALGAARHHELTNATAAAFFGAYLQDDRSARCTLRRSLASENRELRIKCQGASEKRRRKGRCRID